MSSTPETKLSESHTDNKKVPVSTGMPEYISLDKWADTGYEWSGDVELNIFKRLDAILNTEHEQKKISISANLYRHNNVLHLAFTLTGNAWLTCQRCLQPVAIELSDDYNIALLEKESQVRLVDEEQDYLLLEEVITEQSPESLLPFKKLVEDEILLKIPMAPKHDDCEMTVE